MAGVAPSPRGVGAPRISELWAALAALAAAGSVWGSGGWGGGGGNTFMASSSGWRPGSDCMAAGASQLLG